MSSIGDDRFDIFVSYAEADRDWVQNYLLVRLAAAGVKFFERESFRLGVPILEEFARGVQASRRTLLVLSPAYLADKFAKFATFLGQHLGLENSDWPVIPLIRQPVELPPVLRILTPLLATDSNLWPDAVERLCAELRHGAVAVDRPECPYPGMRPFDEKYAPYFFGRDDEIQKMYRHFRSQSFLLLVGATGSGKSSLVQAGLVQRLGRGDDDFPKGLWLIRSMRPGSQPLASLSECLHGDLDRLDETLTQVMATQAGARRLLLVVDQLEEVFTQSDHATQTRFFEMIKQLRTRPECALLLAMSANFYSDLIGSDLWPVPDGQMLTVLPLKEEALKSAVQKPASFKRVYLEDTLVERLVADAAHEPGVLPLVQETMRLLWASMNDNHLSLAAYHRLGGLAVALATKADATLAVLSEPQKEVARRIFLRLIQFGEGRNDTRRQLSLGELMAGEELGAFRLTLSHLTRNHLLTQSGEIGDEGRVDIAHESLINGWPLLQNWLKEQRREEQMRRWLRDRARRWLEFGHPEEGGGLLDELELRQADEWLGGYASKLGADSDLIAFVMASRQRIDRERAEIEAQRRRELEAAQARAREQEENAERDRQRIRDLERLRLVSVTQALAASAAREQGRKQDERGALLARQAYLLDRRTGGEITYLVDEALRSVLGVPQFSIVLSNGHGISVVAFSPDGTKLAIAGGSGEIRILDLRRLGSAPLVWRGHEGPINSLAFSPGGDLLASAGKDKTVRLWNLSQPDANAQVMHGIEGPIRAVAYSPDGHWLAAAGSDRQGTSGAGEEIVRLWDRHSLGPPIILKGHTNVISCICFSDDSRLLASVSYDKTIRLCDLQSPKDPLHVLEGHEKSITAAVFVDGTRRLVSAGEDGLMLLWELGETGATIVSRQIFDFKLHALAFDPLTRKIVAAGEDGSLWLRTLDRPEVPPIVEQTDTTPVVAVAFHPKGLSLASVDLFGTVRLREMRGCPDGSCVLDAHTSGISGLAFRPGAGQLVSVGYDGTMRIWVLGARGARKVHTRDCGGLVTSVAFRPDGRVLAFAGEDGMVCLWDCDRPGEPPVPLQGHKGPVMAVAFSPDGRTLASAGWDSTVRLWATGLHQAPPDCPGRVW